MKILYHIMSLNNIYAERTIYYGYKHAFIDEGHAFYSFTHSENFTEKIKKIKPDIFITSLTPHYIKHLDLDVLAKQRKKGLKVFVHMPVWKASNDMRRINESSGVSADPDLLALIQGNSFGDIYFNVLEPEDKRMEGFEKTTRKKHYTIPLAADKSLMDEEEFKKKFQADISFIGTYHPAKKELFEKYLFPLQKKYNVKLYGQDWTKRERFIGFLQKVGQYFTIPYLDAIQKPKLALGDEPKIYASSRISINLHTSYQQKYGGDCNERTFKIPLYGGFEITDDVACIRKYFVPDKEIIIAKNKKDWFDKIGYYIQHPEERKKIITAGKARVLKDHTYHNRVKQMLEIYASIH